MIFGGLELIALKWVGGKMTAALATHLAHAGPTAVAHFAHAATTNVVTSAAGASTASGAAGTLYHGARAGYKLTRKVNRIKERDARMASMFGAGNASMTDEQRAEMLAVMALMHLMEGYYASLERTPTSSGVSKKTALDEMEPCEDCVGCKDYNPEIGRKCVCGHYAYSHAKITDAQFEDPESFEWLQRGMAAEVYPLLENRDGDGDLKKVLGQIDTCAEYGCPCWDFDRDHGRELFSRRCTCGHRYREHQVTGEWRWIIGLLVAKTVEEIMGEESSSDSSDDDDDDDDDDTVDVDDDNDGGYYDSDDDENDF
ncbi:hypothetical protein B0H66DRAFT_630281 [Apodospora peruviana]|uniref:Uncharacterized protein n=1 Tax=Apodospora peruviana TaxID=516989 RepID=A0AAE0M042_9PEZI|nr:hypothetical protein B0H66DRAFT_630281 [Apodospora peruviana]